MKYYNISDELLKEIHSNVVSYELRERIEDEYPTLFPKQIPLRIGCWYKGFLNGGDRYILFPFLGKFGNEGSYGFNALGDWMDSIGVQTEGIIYEIAPEEEVLEALVREAERRGYSEGTEINSFFYSTSTLTDGGRARITEDGTEFWYRRCALLKDGEWAEIINTIPQAD